MIKTLKNLLKQDKERYSVPRKVQDVIPIQRIWKDGIFQVGSRFSKTYKFTDINYLVASREDKESMFLAYSELLNSLDSGATTKITINNRRLNKANFEQSILMPMRGDSRDVYRREYNQMLLDKVTGANSISKSTSFPILKDGSYHADVRYMSEAASERLSQDINANPNDRFDYENYYDTFFSVNFTVGNYDFPLEFRPNYGGISILIPESRMPEFNAEITSKEIMIQSPNYANIQKNTTDYLTSVGLAEDVSIFSSAESYESQRNFAAMIKLFSTSFLILLTVISCANVFNVITTSLNMRKREFAVLRSVGMTVNKLFAMLCIENLRNGLLAILIGGISSLPLCYLIYKSIVVGAVIDFVFPLGAFVISSLAMFLIMFLTSLYGLWKIKNGDIIADVRNDFV